MELNGHHLNMIEGIWKKAEPIVLRHLAIARVKKNKV